MHLLNSANGGFPSRTGVYATYDQNLANRREATAQASKPTNVAAAAARILSGYNDIPGRFPERSSHEPHPLAGTAEKLEFLKTYQDLAVKTFGLDVLTAAAMPASKTSTGCKWCFANASATVNRKASIYGLIAFQKSSTARDNYRQAATILLGPSCRRCREAVATLTAAKERRDSAMRTARLRQQCAQAKATHASRTRTTPKMWFEQ